MARRRRSSSDNASNAWSPQVAQRDHPPGEDGVFSSLTEVAERAAKGSVSPKIRMWAIECLDRARKEKGLRVNTERERAEILLGAVQQKLWVPDPIGCEWMAGAHLMACDSSKDGVCFRGNDCDDLVILLASCFSSVGIYTLIVGHAYDLKDERGKRVIQHVLCAARVDGQWMYADPSTDMALGECLRFSRERIYSIPNVQMLCDDRVCLRDPKKFGPYEVDFVGRGQFVGVDGVPQSFGLTWLVEPDEGTLGGKTGSQAGAAAGSGACAAEGASAAAIPICAKLGGKVGDLAEESIKGLMSGPNKQADEQAQVSAAERAKYEIQAELNRMLNFLLVELSEETGRGLPSIVDELRSRGVEIGSNPNLAPPGVKPLMSGGDWIYNTLAITYPYYAPAFWQAIISNHLGKFSPSRWQRLQDAIRTWIGQLDYGVVGLSAQSAGHIVKAPTLMVDQPKKKKSVLLPVLAVGAGAALLWVFL